jgi:NTE family protein
MSNSGQPPAGEAQLADLVFEGGGVKGIGLAGAFRELEARGYTPGCVAGTSAGAITAALVAAGYSGPELEDIVLRQMHFQQFADQSRIERIGPAGEIVEFLRTRGLHSGNYFLKWMRDRLAAKGVHTFADLRDDATNDEKRRYRLQVVASDLSAHRMLVLPRDAAVLGLDPDRLEVAYAVRMSMSIPVFFRPVQVVDPRSGDTHVIVDGGLLSNFPVWLFDCQGAKPSFPTFGMLLVAPGQKAPLIPDRDGTHTDGVAAIGSNVAFVRAMADTMMEAHDRLYVEDANYARTIPIQTLGVRTTDFAIAPDRAAALFQSGRDAATQFLAGWDFQAYIERFRKPDGPGASGRRSRPALATA